MPDAPDDAATRPSRLEAGTRVEVRTGFDRTWVNGFRIDAVEAAGYRVRRRSDDQVLPVALPFDDVRRERNNMWWV